ncbi:MAG: hypothetical protein HKN03_18035 [Acidimicrobiales bacterium]|nr:hypothetical protein [Acidimicrobiales bacterium]
MKPSDLRDFLQPLADTISVYLSVEGPLPAEEVVSVALNALPDGQPDWLQRSAVETAVEDARRIHAAGVCFFGRSDGSLAAPLVDPPRFDIAELAPVPRLVPLVETMHRDVDHLVVHFDPTTRLLEFARFPEAAEATSWTQEIDSGDPAEISQAIIRDVHTDTEVVVVSVPDEIANAVVDRLDPALPPTVKVSAVSPDEDLSRAAVRAVADFTAVATVQAIRSFRFMESHGAVVEGLAETALALARGEVTRLFLSPGVEEMTLYAGQAPTELGSADNFASGAGLEVRASDGLLRSAILQGVMVQVTPDHLHDGPSEGVGATVLPAG